MTEICVITAVHPDRSDHLMRTYESIRSQQGVDWTWCVVIDGPGPEIEIERVRDKRIRRYRLDRPRGAAYCRNTAVLLDRSPLLRNLDGDDFLYGESSLALAVANLQRPRVGFAVSVTLDQLPDGSRTEFASTFTPYGRISRGYWGTTWRQRRYFDMRAHTLACRRDLYWVAGGYRAMEFAEDVTLIVSMNEICDGWFEETPSSVYRQWPGQMSAPPDRPWQLDETYSQVSEAVASVRSFRHGGPPDNCPD